MCHLSSNKKKHWQQNDSEMKFFWTVPFLYQKLKTSRKVYVIDADITKQWSSPQMTRLYHRQTTCIIAVCLIALLLSPICFCVVILTNMKSFNYHWSWGSVSEPDPESGRLVVCPGSPKENSTHKFVISLDSGSAKNNIQAIQKNFPNYSVSDSGTANDSSMAPSYLDTKVNCSLDETSSGRRCSDLRTLMRCFGHKFGYKAAKGRKLNPCFLVKIENAKVVNPENNSSLKPSNECVSGNVCMGCRAKHPQDQSKFSRLRFSREWNTTAQPASFMVQVVELQPKVNLTLLCWLSFFREGSMRRAAAVTIQLVQ